jgi:hypothetical protein
MTTLVRRLALALAVVFSANAAAAQTADEIIEKSIAAMGGRAAFSKLKSRVTTGTITLQTPAGDVSGPVEVWNVAPNKSRTTIKADLTALGAGQLTVDQRFDGKTGYVMDSLQGDREITGNQLDNLRNGTFPHPFIGYKDFGTTAKMTGKEKVGDRDAFVVVFEPVTGSPIKQYIDAETYMPVKMSIRAMVPQLGQELEQVTEFLDVKEVDGVKIPFRLRATSAVQSFTITVQKIEHNTKMDDAMFVKPAK